jgi:hypothetical protein
MKGGKEDISLRLLKFLLVWCLYLVGPPPKQVTAHIHSNGLFAHRCTGGGQH